MSTKSNLPNSIGDAGVALEPGERRGVQVEHRVAIPGDLLRVGLAMEHAEDAAVPLGGLDLELPGGEREEVGRDRLRLGVADARAAV